MITIRKSPTADTRTCDVWQIGDGLIFVLCCNCAKTHTYKLIERAESFLESKRAVL